ncbi:BnaC02g19390D [Brassica napus]|uniref:BnaC02g19390D protein n=1 Tax=Brassica napus TaxID=3708 RepID=A0A078GPW7_BRANA|nr:BnaC02g19390D [Brassica napus]
MILMKFKTYVLGYRARSIPTAIAAGATLAGTSALIYSGDQKTRVDNGSREYYPYTPV